MHINLAARIGHTLKKDCKVLGEELTFSNSVSCRTGQMFHLCDAAGSSQMLGGQLAAGQSDRRAPEEPLTDESFV